MMIGHENTQAPSREVFAEFYERHVVAILAFASRRVGRSAAEDVVAEVFVRAFRSMPVELYGMNDVGRAWLFRVSRNLMISLSRRERTASDKAHLVATPAETSPVLDRHEMLGHLDWLPERQRRVLELRFVEDLDATAAGVRLGIGAEATRALTLRALKNLRALIAADGESSD